MTWTTEDRNTLYVFLTNQFSLEEMKTLTFMLGVPYDNFPYHSRPEFARELIDHCERRSWLGCLVTQVLRFRPDEAIGLLLSHVPQCERDILMQIIVDANRLTVTPDVLRNELSKFFVDIPPDAIRLIAIAPGSYHFLFAVPTTYRFREHAASKLLFNKSDGSDKYHPNIQLFDSLTELDQATWLEGYKQGYWLPSRILQDIKPLTSRIVWSVVVRLLSILIGWWAFRNDLFNQGLVATVIAVGLIGVALIFAISLLRDAFGFLLILYVDRKGSSSAGKSAKIPIKRRPEGVKSWQEQQISLTGKSNTRP